MDIKKALELIESGRYEEIDLEDIWEIVQVLSSSSDARAVQALMTLQNSPVGRALPQASLEMHHIIENNARLVKNLEKDFNLFELDKSGQPVYAEVLPIFNFFSRVEIENKPGDEPVKAETLFPQAVELAKTTAKKDLFLDKNFAKLKPEEQKKSYINAVLMAIEENAFVLVSNQILENTKSENPAPMTTAEKDKIAEVAEQRFAAMINPQSNVRFKLSNTNIIGTAFAGINRIASSAALIQENTGSKQLIDSFRQLNKKLAPSYPQSFKILRQLAKAPDLGFMVSKAGEKGFFANKIAAQIHDTNPAKEQKEISLFAFLKQQPSKLKSFSRSIVTSIKKAYDNVYEAMRLGLVNEQIRSGFKKMFSHFASHPNDKYNGVGRKTMEGNIKVMSATVSRIINQPAADKRVVAWKDFRNTFYSSHIGRAMALNPELNSHAINPERTTLVSERQEDYTKVTTIVLKRRDQVGDKASQAVKSGLVKRVIKAPLNMAARVARAVRGSNR